MEQPNFIEIKKKPATVAEDGITGDHAEALALVEKHRDFFEHYAKGRIKVEPAPQELSTFAFNLEKNTIYVNSMFYRKRGFSEQKTVFAILHEIEHFLEKKQILLEEGGVRKFEKYLQKIKASRAFSLMDNCVADIRENKTVVSRTNVGIGALEQQIYKEDLFHSIDFTKDPKHLQFSQAILREARVPGEICLVAPDVRAALDEVSKVPRLLEIMTNPNTPMSMRLRLQDKYIWPKVEALLEKDIEDKKEQKKQQDAKKDQSDKSDDNQGEGKSGEEDESGEEEGQEGKPSKSTKKRKPGKTGKSAESAPDAGDEFDIDETDPNKIFSKEYDELEKKFAEAVPMEEIEKAFKEWKEAQSGKDSGEALDEAYAHKIGVEKADLQRYREIAQANEKIVNPETGVGVLEELKNLFQRIIAKRVKPNLAPKYPVAEGDELVDPAQLVADVKAGNLEPRVWEDTEIRDKKGDKFGEVEITLVCDRSSSMTESGGQKAVEQRKSAVLVMEVLKEFAELCEEERINIDQPLEVRSEIYTFAGQSTDSKPLKEMSSELGEAERINALKALYDLPGSTTDYICLEAIEKNLDQGSKQKITEGVLKKIVIVMTDGGSDSPADVQIRLKALRDSGVVVIGLGMTVSGKPVLSTYAPNALVVEDISKLPIVLGELLKEHLKDI